MYNAPIMLKLLRDKSIQKKIYIGLAAVVTVSFVVSGIMISGDGGRSSSSLARLDKRKISVQEYLNSYRAVQRQAGFMYGDKLDEMRSRINFKGEAWDRLLLLDYAKKEGIRTSDKEVVDWITKQEGFYKDGKFNDAYYRLYVERALRSTPRQFEEEIRQMLTLGKIQDSLRGGLELTDEKLKELYREENTEKDILFAVLPKESFESQVNVTDEDIEQLYDAVKDKLTSPEDGRALTLEESKEEVKKLYRAQNAAALAVKRLVDLKAKMKTQADFENILKEEKLEVTPYEKYKKDVYPAGIWPSNGLQKTTANLGEGEIGEPFEVPKGAMISMVTKVHPFDEKKFEEEKKYFQDQITAKRSAEELQVILEKLRNKLSLNLDLMKDLFPSESSS